MGLTRKGKILRNLLLALLLWAVSWAALDFPAYTTRGMCDQMARSLLLPELQPIYTRHDRPRKRMIGEEESAHLVIARSGETYVSFRYLQRGLCSSMDYGHHPPKMGNGALAMPYRGTMYVAGDFSGVEQAELCMKIQPFTMYYEEQEWQETVKEEERQFRFTGEKQGEELFTFRYRDDSLWPNESLLFFLSNEEDPERREEPEALIYAYRNRQVGETDGGWLHVDIPLEVRLYDGGGKLLDTLEFQVDTYEFSNW